MDQEVNVYELKAGRQSENMTGIKGKIEKEEAKELPNQDQAKLGRWYRELRRTEAALRRTQVRAY